MKRLLPHIVFLLLMFSPLYAETIVVGEITDARTGTPVANANVYYKGTRTGCATNQEGMFMLRCELDKERTLVISAVGYKSQHYRIQPGQYLGIAVALEEKTTMLEDVLIVPGSNPALPLMERVRQQRPANNPDYRSDVVYILNEQKELYISEIDRRHLQRHLWKSLRKGMLQAEDSTFLLPLYHSRQMFRLQGSGAETVGTAHERSSVLTATDYSALLGGIDLPVNFYRNSVTVLGKTFLSPLASSGNRYYRYYLTDSLSNAAEKHYVVQFRSRNPFFACFNGEMEIDSATCALRSIAVSVPRDNAVNYLSSLCISQRHTATHTVCDEDLSLLLDFAVKTDSSHLFPTVLLRRSLKSNEEAVRWKKEIPPMPVGTDSTAVAGAMDSLERMPVIRVARFAAEVISTGYIPTGTVVDIGNVTDLLRVNPHECVHVGLPLRTNSRLWRNVSLGGYVGYGFRDRAWKGKGLIQVQLPSERRNTLNMSYEDSYVWSEVSDLDKVLRENSIGTGTMNFTTALVGNFRTTAYAVNSATRRREAHLWSENEWTDRLETSLHIRTGRMGYGNPMVGYGQIPSYAYTSLSALFRLSWGESRTDLYFRRVRRYSRYPVLYMQLEGGGYRMPWMEADRLYGRLGISIRQCIPLGMLGEIDYALQGGIIFGSVPYPLLQVFNGNQTYAFDPYRFTLMNQWQYAADRYMLLHAQWNLNGALLNRIPGVRYLHLRELLELKVAWGGLSDKHKAVLAFPGAEEMGAPAGATLFAPLHVPYVEVGIGLGNILRVGELWSVWRLTNRTDKSAPLWALRFRLHLSL